MFSSLHWLPTFVEIAGGPKGEDLNKQIMAGKYHGDHEAAVYGRWRVDHAFVLVPAQGYVAKHLATFKDLSPRQKPGSFSLDQVL
jgi:hypothetical protein